MKWELSDYKSNRRFLDWTPPPLVYPCSDDEKQALHALKEVFAPLTTYKELEQKAVRGNTCVEVNIPIPNGHITFLENTAEQCASPQTKHSSEGMQGARHWVQRVDTPDNMFERLTDGYGISLMFGERCHQYIRNSNNWRGISGCMLDIDVFRDEKHPDAPAPVYSLNELFDRYPLIPQICSFILPSASSLYEGRPFKARGVVLFPEPVTDMRVYRAFGDILCGEIDCIPANVTKNPVAVGFGNTHNARLVFRSENADSLWITDALKKAEASVLSTAKKRQKERKKKAELVSEHYAAKGNQGTGEGENISTFIEKCDPISEMLSDGLLTRGTGNEYQWHESEHDRSCEILGDGVLHIYSHTMSAASPASELEPVNAHRFYLYQLSGLDMTKAGDKEKCREFLFERGYGSDPKQFAKHQQRPNASLTITGDAQETLATLTDNDNALTEAFTNALTETDADTPHYHIVLFEMGSGKNHSLLTSLATLKKRGIGIFENHEQVDEQVLKARLMGLSSAKLRGRGYKFADSGLRDIDVHARRLFDEVFQRHPEVLCAFYDVIETREEKGLAPYPYCLNCPFYKNQSCPYINQFVGVSENDFIATCMHDLFFDPNFRHILAGLWRTPEDSEEETIIGDALGLAPKEASAFDLGILDEVIARNLYLDYTYSFQDMHELADAWEGEPLADFMKQLLDCLNAKKDTPLEKLQTHIETLSENVQMLIASQMTQIPEDVDVHEHTLRDRATENVLSEAYIEEGSGIQRRIPVSKAAEAILREKKVPVRPYRKIAPKTKIGVSPYRGNGVSPDEVAGRLWAGGWTLLDQLQKAIQMDIAWIGTKYNVNGEQVCCDTFTITVPPQVSDIAKLLILMGGTMDVENIITAFERQDVNFTASNGIPARYAKGVKTYQLTDRRLTYRSVFEVETDADGKTVFDADTQKPLVIGLTAPAETELEKLCMLAEKHIAEGNLKPVFISYKDFTETPISETPIVQRMHRCLQVKHFDLTRGLNFDGVKVFIVYGLPKSARPEVVKQTAEILYHTELAQTPLDMTYQRGNEVREGYKAENIGVYADKRMEAVRQQLTRDKSKQALYRARPTRWQDTITLHFSAEPIPDWTERATGFVRTDLQTAERFEDIGGVIKARENAEQNGDVKALASATGQSERTTYRKTDPTRNQRKVDMQARAYQLYCEKCHNDTIIARLQSEYGKKVTDRTLQRWRKKDKF